MGPDIGKFLAALRLGASCGHAYYLKKPKGWPFESVVYIDGAWTFTEIEAALSAAVDARVSELLAANNAEVERRRKAEADFRKLEETAEVRRAGHDAYARATRIFSDKRNERIRELEARVAELERAPSYARGYIVIPTVPSESILHALSVALAIPRAGAAAGYAAIVRAIVKDREVAAK